MAAGMDTSKKSNGKREKALTPETLGLAQQGVRTGKDFAGLMSSLMTDLISGRITPQVGNAVCNAGGKLLKIVEMQYKYGSTEPQHRPDVLLTQSEQ